MLRASSRAWDREESKFKEEKETSYSSFSSATLSICKTQDLPLPVHGGSFLSMSFILLRVGIGQTHLSV